MGQQVIKKGGIQSFVGLFSRDTAAASGNQVVNGLGFSPKAVIFFASTGEAGEGCWGFDNLLTYLVMYDNNIAVVDTYEVSEGSYSINIKESGADLYRGRITTLDVDGFTIAWTKTGNPTGTLNVGFLAIK